MFLLQSIVKSSDDAVLAADFGGDDFCLLEDDHCVICLENWQNGQSIRKSGNCSHIFHSGCILSWIRETNECPNCRACFLPGANDAVGIFENEDMERRADYQIPTAPPEVVDLEVGRREG